MNLAVIPARGGSKRIPRKNIRPFSGKPIIAYSIEAALGSGLFDAVIVTTDDEAIAETARTFGATTPFMRPAELSDDMTGTTPVFRHAVQWHLDHGMDVSAACCIYATAPFTTSGDIRRGYEALETAPASFSVTTFPYPIFRGLEQHADKTMSLIWPEHRDSRSQDLTEAYHDCGQFYWAKRDFLMGGKRFIDGEAAGIRIPRHRVQDIDTEEDWARAEIMHRVLRESNEI